ncbi:hypothetical protein FRC04_010201 [Tulasnella sp. 424]|nr:hypothetical protein FRC04_010201 [Tulasnella sp. 424]KAG8966427.1 hypothetical protein FRC05_002673 [Tulasnella sp. 425]
MYAFSVIAALLSVVSASPASGVPASTVYIGPCTDSIKPHAHIIASPDTTLVAGLQLSTGTSGRATLTDGGIYSLWDFSNGGLGVKPDCGPTGLWLNIDPVVTDYKPLYWNTTQITTNWSAAYGKVLAANGTKTYSTTDTFIACRPVAFAVEKAPWYLFLQTPGTIVPLADAVSLKDFDTTSCVKTKLTIENPTYGTEI